MDLKKIVRTVGLSLLSLGAMVLCGVVVIWVFDSVMGWGYEDLWLDGFRAGFLAWIIEIIWNTVKKLKKKAE